MDKSYSDKKYFAAQPLDKIADEVLKRVDNYYDFLRTIGKLNLWRRSYEYYNRGALKLGRLVKTGQHGEFTMINVNHYRNLIQHLLIMATSQKPAFEPRATNTDHESTAQTILASGLLDYYLREKKVDRYLKTATEHGILFGESFVAMDWDSTIGNDYGADPETGQVIKEGDLIFQNYTPIDVIRDFTKNDCNSHDWYILRKWENRFVLAAKYPELAEKILNLSEKSDFFHQNRLSTLSTMETDDIAVFTFYHTKNAALPEGRMVQLVDRDIIFNDGPLPFDSIPLFRLAPDNIVGGPFGYSIAFDLLPLQEALDGLYSTIITNQSTFGVQNIAVPRGSNINVTQLAGGLNIIEYDPKLGAKPEGLNLTQTPPEVFNFIMQLEKTMETISGVNSVARGNPESSLKSGNALALVQSMAIQFSQGLIQSYIELLEDVGTAIIKILQTYAQTPRIARIAGKANRPYMKEFKGEDLGLISRVVVDAGNPLSRTTAGKVNIADNLLAQGMIENPDQYIQVLTTGKLEPVIEGKTAQIMLIKAENEKLGNGEFINAILTDKHNVHILEHAVVLASPESRENPQIVSNTLNHIQQHIEILKTADPATLGMMGQQSIAPPPMMGPPGMLPPPGESGLSPNIEPNNGQMLEATNPVTQQAAKVNLPNAPKNALSGETWNPATGGL